MTLSGSNSNNSWDDGFPSGGNYWSDYEVKYPNATELDGSGFWDTPYIINGSNQDSYPIIPEFPSLILLPLLLLATSLVTLVRKKKGMHARKRMSNVT